MHTEMGQQRALKTRTAPAGLMTEDRDNCIAAKVLVGHRNRNEDKWLKIRRKTYATTKTANNSFVDDYGWNWWLGMLLANVTAWRRIKRRQEADFN